MMLCEDKINSYIISLNNKKIQIGYHTNMAKIVIRIPEPKEDYDVSNQKQINRAIALIVEQLNSTFLNELKQESERFTWFKSAGGNS